MHMLCSCSATMTTSATCHLLISMLQHQTPIITGDTLHIYKYCQMVSRQEPSTHENRNMLPVCSSSTATSISCCTRSPTSFNATLKYLKCH